MDPIISTDDVLYRVKNAKNTTLEILVGIGHMGHVEAPKKCLELIQNFIRK